ncbi:MAG TPA: BACON domain-containing carbohydrate-binding protein [Blastocatellia bacterium]|nr:BACON domain-containing carbohydrate-binding protein [Blastocatellia bacterium]
MFRSLLCVSLICILALMPSPVTATSGDLDTSFGNGGKVITDFFGFFDFALAMARQSDEKIVVAGFIQQPGTGLDFGLARYNIDGTLDPSFGSGGKVTTDFQQQSDEAQAIAIQSDGKIVVAGSADTPIDDFALARYNTDGSLDASFGSGGKVTTNFASSLDRVNALAIQADGKIIAAGDADLPGFQAFALARYNSNGSLDTSFGTNGKVTTDFFHLINSIKAIAIQSDGRIIAGGTAVDNSTIPATTNFAVARYNTDGSLDDSFGSDGKVTTNNFGLPMFANSLTLQSDGKVVVAGGTRTDETEADFALVRYNSDGSLDDSFGSGGRITTDFFGEEDIAWGVALQSNGKIVVSGEAETDLTGSDFALVRFDSNGELDPSFGSGGKAIASITQGDDIAAAIVIQADGKIVAAGCTNDSTQSQDFALARYLNCTTSTLTTGAFFPSTGGEATVSVLSPLGCAWAVSSNESWISVTSSVTGEGNGIVTYAVRDNISPLPRQGAMTIAGEVFTVTQEGISASNCGAKISPAFETFNITGGTGVINVSTGAQCAWQAVSNSDWIRIAPTCCGIGSGTVNYTIAANPIGSSRKGVITVAGRTFSVKQKGN